MDEDASIREPTVSDPAFWEPRYHQGVPPWDLGVPPPQLVAHLDELGPSRRRVFVPGAGRGHDAHAWAARGHRVTAVDFSPAAVEQCQQLATEAGVEVEVVLADIFALPSALYGAFDVVWEHTCLCAIDPSRRTEYVDTMAEVLRPGGQLHALLWNHGQPGGPPFTLEPDEVRDLLSPRFAICSLGPVAVSAAGRVHEFFVVAQSRPRADPP